MALTDTSKLLHNSMTEILDTWGAKYDGTTQPLYWLLLAKAAEIGGADVAGVLAKITDIKVKEQVAKRLSASADYWADIRYSSLEPVTMLWGTIVNSIRVAAKTGRVGDKQREIFDYSPASLLAFFQAARDRMEVADGLYHVFRAMPAPECQAMAALLNVHIDARLDEAVMCRLVRLLDHEGPMTLEETQDLDSLSRTHLVNATFCGLRGHA